MEVIKHWPNTFHISFHISFHIVQHCCMHHVERVWRLAFGHPCWIKLNVVEWCWTMLKEHDQIFVQNAFNIYDDLADSGICWMRLAIPDFSIVQHYSTILRGVEQNVESVWPRLHTCDGRNSLIRVNWITSPYVHPDNLPIVDHYWKKYF